MCATFRLWDPRRVLLSCSVACRALVPRISNNVVKAQASAILNILLRNKQPGAASLYTGLLLLVYRGPGWPWRSARDQRCVHCRDCDSQCRPYTRDRFVNSEQSSERAASMQGMQVRLECFSYSMCHVHAGSACGTAGLRCCQEGRDFLSSRS